MNAIFDGVLEATVIITAVGGNGGREPVGSGFFVAPGWVLSCAHVVARATDPRVLWRGRELVPTEIACDPKVPAADGGFAFPDTAVLRVPVPDPAPPCVPITLDLPTPRSEVWATGIGRIRTGRPESYSSTLTVADRGPGDRAGLFRLERGRVVPGMSGGPVLDLNTFAVCGITKATQDQRAETGGWAVPIAAALAVTAEPLARLNAEHHADGLPALRARQVGFGGLPARVLTYFTGNAGLTDLLVAHLKDLGFEPPWTLHPDRRAEWAVRRLFDLSLDELVYALSDLHDNLAGRTLRIFDFVACCVAVAHGSAWWIAGEAALGLRQEVQRDAPRVVRVCTDEDASVQALMTRAFDGRPFEIVAVGGPSSAGDDGEDGAAADIRAEIERQVAITEDEWRAEPSVWADVRRTLRSDHLFLKVRVDATLDATHLEDLLHRFPGLLFLVSKRELAIPDGVESVLLDLVPPIELRPERLSVSRRAKLVRTLTNEG